ncbi:uncharacterized protein TNCV_1105611 [Trichonephila clavipes]|nr:uncharacterized protein TNCV_1105611 [Trichonephila clavipes]
MDIQITVLRNSELKKARTKKADHDFEPRFMMKIPSDIVQRVSVEPTRGLLATDHVILNHGQVTWTTPELAPPLLTTPPHQREDFSALDRFNVHRCPTRQVMCLNSVAKKIRRVEALIHVKSVEAKVYTLMW